MRRGYCRHTWPALGLLTALAGTGITAWANEEDVHHVPLFPAASDPHGRQGFVRIINHEHDSGEVTIRAVDDSGYTPEGITLSIGGEKTVHFNSDDLENGGESAEEKGLSGSVGMGQEGDWRLELTSSLDIEVLAYIRHEGGFLTSMHDTSPSADRRHRVAVFNPGSNESQVSLLRLVNPGEEDAHVEIVGIDDEGESPGEPVEVTVAAGQSRTLSAKQLEEGEEGEFEGALGDGKGKWKLNVTSRQPILVMGLLRSPNNYLTNLSTAPASEFETAFEVFEAVISEPIVQLKCVTCHVLGGPSDHTPLVFMLASDDDGHLTTNFNVFKDYLADREHDDDSPMNVILDKIQGNRTHEGGVQVAADSEDFHNMERFLELLVAEVEDAPDDHDD